MAQVTIGDDGNLTVTLTTAEKSTVSLLEDDSLAQYITLWIEGQWPRVVSKKLAALSDTDKADVMDKLSRRPR